MEDMMTDDELKLHQIRALVVGVGRTGRPNDGMDMLADSVLRILDEGPLPYRTSGPDYQP
jgi:hypothetical protein